MDIEKRRKQKREWYHQHLKQERERHREHKRRIYQQRRETIILHYGGSPIKCACCDFTSNMSAFFAIDHKNGGGREERKRLGYMAMQQKIIKEEFPNDYQVICANCNQAKRVLGICPHQNKHINEPNVASGEASPTGVVDGSYKLLTSVRSN